MRRTPLFGSLAVLTIWIVALGLIVGRFELFFAAVPLVVALLSANKPAAAAGIAITASPSSTRLTEGDRLDLVVAVASLQTASPVTEVFVALPDTFELIEGRPHLATSLRAGETFEWKLAVRSTARGRAVLGPFHVRVSDDAGLQVDEARVGPAVEIETYPSFPMVRQLPRPWRTRSSFGNYVTAAFGTGLETAETRLFAAGDRMRRINWAASLRLGRLYVNQFHQEHSADVVLLLDTTAETGASPQSSLDASVRAVTALASAYIARKDRVGYVEFGAYLRWLKPAAGRRQWERVLRSAVPASQHFTYLSRTLDHVPAAALPRHALVIAVSPIIDERFTRAIVDLAGRGHDVVLLAVCPVGLTRRVLPDTPLSDAACALWTLERASRIRQLGKEGIAVAEWQPDQPLDAALASLARRAPVRRALP